MMRRIFSLLSIICAVIVGANASVLGIFDDTNLPTPSECGGVHRLEIVNGELYAATEKGIYKYSESADTWDLWALENVNVMDFKTNGDEAVAVIAPEDLKGFRAVEMATLIRFNRNQPEWEDIMDAGMGYSYKGQSLTYVMRLAQHPAKPETLVAECRAGRVETHSKVRGLFLAQQLLERIDKPEYGRRVEASRRHSRHLDKRIISPEN